MGADGVVVIGAGIAGLVAAVELARAGFAVRVLERQPTAGGKMRQLAAGGAMIDAGPTVFTMRWVFDRIFGDAGRTLDDLLELQPLDILARHAWSGGERLDLWADVARSTDAIGAFSGPQAARGFRDFCARAKTVYQTLEGPFIRSTQPSPVSLALGAGLRGLGDMWRIQPFSTLWSALGDYFTDPRLRQLFGRYATYCGSSPFEAPATLMLVAHVEQDGVWVIKGGMQRLAEVLVDVAREAGAEFHFNTEATDIQADRGRVSAVRLRTGEVMAADHIIVNADCAAVAAGLLGGTVSGSVAPVRHDQRSLSAVTWAMHAPTSGFPLVRHNVFFSDDYAGEFDDIFKRRRLPRTPTVYVCAQDRGDQTVDLSGAPERMLVLVNAPPSGDVDQFQGAEVAACEERTFSALAKMGLNIDSAAGASVRTTPAEFSALFPGTGGALYGAASHGWASSFSRPSGKTRIPGLYLAGGSVHPGPGVPMAAMSGWLAAAQLVVDRGSSGPSRRTGMRGGTSTR